VVGASLLVQSVGESNFQEELRRGHNRDFDSWDNAAKLTHAASVGSRPVKVDPKACGNDIGCLTPSASVAGGMFPLFAVGFASSGPPGSCVRTDKRRGDFLTVRRMSNRGD